MFSLSGSTVDLFICHPSLFPRRSTTHTKSSSPRRWYRNSQWEVGAFHFLSEITPFLSAIGHLFVFLTVGFYEWASRFKQRSAMRMPPCECIPVCFISGAPDTGPRIDVETQGKQTLFQFFRLRMCVFGVFQLRRGKEGKNIIKHICSDTMGPLWKLKGPLQKVWHL